MGGGEKRDHEPWILGEVSGVVKHKDFGIICKYLSQSLSFCPARCYDKYVTFGGDWYEKAECNKFDQISCGEE